MLHFRYILILFTTSLVLVLHGCEDILKKDISAMDPIAELSADELLFGLEEDENFYKEEILSVEGSLVEVNTKNGNLNFLMRGNTNQNHYVICEMNHSITLGNKDVSEGETIVIKGILKGYLNDAVLLNCVLDKTNKNE